MKKLMIAAAIVCAAAFSQAATLKWGDGTLKDQAGNTAGADVHMASFYLGASTDSDGKAAAAYTYLTTLATQSGIDAAQKYMWDNYSAANGTLTINGVEFAAKNADRTASGGEVLSTTVSGLSSGTTYYFASIFQDKDGTGADAKTDYYMANVGSFTASAGSKVYDKMGTLWLGEDGTAEGKVTWQSVPEPISGLLLLLGVAGLALRRRRA